MSVSGVGFFRFALLVIAHKAASGRRGEPMSLKGTLLTAAQRRSFRPGVVVFDLALIVLVVAATALVSQVCLALSALLHATLGVVYLVEMR
jgi:hypothetical protein